MKKLSLAEKLSQITDQWRPRVIAELNGQHVRVVKIRGEFIWHQHEDEDEMFLVLKGKLKMDYREDGQELQLELTEGELIVVPRGTEHRPSADEETHILLFEPATTVNTGNVQSERTVDAAPI